MLLCVRSFPRYVLGSVCAWFLPVEEAGEAHCLSWYEYGELDAVVHPDLPQVSLGSLCLWFCLLQLEAHCLP